MFYPRTERQTRFIALAQTLAVKFAERAAEHDRNGTFDDRRSWRDCGRHRHFDVPADIHAGWTIEQIVRWAKPPSWIAARGFCG